MTTQELYRLLDQQIVWNLVEVYQGSLHDTIKRIFEENLIHLKDPDRAIAGFAFYDSKDPRVLERYITCSYQGETLREVITDIENEHPVVITFDPNLHGGYWISVEWKAR